MSDEPTIEAPAEATPAPAEQPRDEHGKFAPVEQAEAEESTEQAADDAESEENDGESHDDLHEGKKRGKSAEARINELTRKFRETERELALFKGLVSQSTPVSPSEGAEKPTADQFDTYDEFIDALTDWKVGNALAKTSSETATRAQEAVKQASWASKLEAAQAILPDFASVVGSSEIPVAQHVADALMDSERGPELAYHMAQHPDVAERLNKLSPVRAAIEIGRLETALAAPVAKPMSKAPPPATPLRPAPARGTDLSSASMDDYIAQRAKQGASWAR